MEKGLIKKATLPLALIVSGALLYGCASPRAQYNPYPSQDKSAQQYHRDVAECRDWAASQAGADPNRALNEGAQGALGGAIFGTALGAIFGGRRGAGQGALAGAVIGGGAGGISGSQNAQAVYDMAYADCLRKKGY